MQALLVYDGTGRVYGMYAGVEEAPSELHGIIATLPEGRVQSVTVNTTTNQPVFVMATDPQETIAELQSEVAELEARLAEYEGENA